MNKSYKVRAIEAAHKLIEKYENRPRGETLPMGFNSCPLCHIYGPMLTNSTCKGCPLANHNGNLGCKEFISYPNNWYTYNMKIKKYKQRIKFWKKVIPILESLPAKIFTPSGWRYFSELDRKW